MFSSPEFAHLNTKVESYKKKADETKEVSENVRKGIFARFDSLKKEVNPRIENLETQMAIMQAMLNKHFGNEESNIIELQEACM